MEKKRLEGKTAWVTGSSRGLGRVIASHLAGLGAHVAVHGTSLYSSRAFDEADSLQAVADAVAQENDAEVMLVVISLTKPLLRRQSRKFGTSLARLTFW